MIILSITISSSNFFFTAKEKHKKNILKNYSAGILGFKNKKKKTNYTFSHAMRLFLSEIKLKNPKCKIHVIFYGFVKPFHINSVKNISKELNVWVSDYRIKTKFAHNGVKAKKLEDYKIENNKWNLK